MGNPTHFIWLETEENWLNGEGSRDRESKNSRIAEEEVSKFGTVGRRGNEGSSERTKRRQIMRVGIEGRRGGKRLSGSIRTRKDNMLACMHALWPDHWDFTKNL